MELKQGINTCCVCSFTLLIVPYGIETEDGGISLPLRTLLIVPYGIETGSSLITCTRIGAFNRTLWN